MIVVSNNASSCGVVASVNTPPASRTGWQCATHYKTVKEVRSGYSPRETAACIFLGCPGGAYGGFSIKCRNRPSNSAYVTVAGCLLSVVSEVSEPRDCHCRQDTDDDNYHYQLNKSKTLLFHLSPPLL